MSRLFAFLLDRLPDPPAPGVPSMSSDSNAEGLDRPPRFLDRRVDTWLRSTTLAAISSRDLSSSACPRRVMSMATWSLAPSSSWLPPEASRSVPGSVDFCRPSSSDGCSALEEEASCTFRIIRRLRLLLLLEERSSGVSTCGSIGDPDKLEAALEEVAAVSSVSSPSGRPNGERRRRRKLCRLSFLAGVH